MPWPASAFKRATQKKKGTHGYYRKSLMRMCRREDSNLHSLNGNQVLNLARLPVPPLRQLTDCILGPASRHRQGLGSTYCRATSSTTIPRASSFSVAAYARSTTLGHGSFSGKRKVASK